MGLTMCEGKYVDRNEIALVPTPTATESWKPVPHMEVIEAVTDVVKAHSWQILEENFGLAREGQKIENNHFDCGLLLYDRDAQDVHAGASGCGCSACVLSAYVIPEMEKGRFHRVLFLASGAMMSPDSIKQGQSIPAIGHLLLLEA